MSAVAGRGPVHVGALSDDELVQLARHGHEPAFDVIVHRYRAPLVSYCRRWLDPHRSEEVVQHTLMKAFMCLRDDDRPLVIRPWLYRVAHNAALNALEKKGSDWEELDENYDGVPQPPQVAEQRARFLKVVDEIGALPLRQREALLLNEFEGRCYADIAAELGTSESGVRGLLRRARRQLREAAAAVLLPFPALRELVRSDAGRSFQAERAGEAIGSAGAAGAAGGLGVAGGGFVKVAAGVLAAGTIAGGGTALEHGHNVWKTPEAKAQGVTATQGSDQAAGKNRLVVATAGDEQHPVAARRIALSVGGVVPERQGSDGIQHEASLQGFESEQRADDGSGLETAPGAEAPTEDTALLPSSDDESADGDELAGGVDTHPVEAPVSKAPGDGDEPDGDEGEPGEKEPGDKDPEDPQPEEQEPESVPATTSPVQPLRH